MQDSAGLEVVKLLYKFAASALAGLCFEAGGLRTSLTCLAVACSLCKIGLRQILPALTAAVRHHRCVLLDTRANTSSLECLSVNSCCVPFLTYWLQPIPVCHIGQRASCHAATSGVRGRLPAEAELTLKFGTSTATLIQSKLTRRSHRPRDQRHSVHRRHFGNSGSRNA